VDIEGIHGAVIKGKKGSVPPQLDSYGARHSAIAERILENFLKPSRESQFFPWKKFVHFESHLKPETNNNLFRLLPLLLKLAIIY
jgi:hypothetical protein